MFVTPEYTPDNISKLNDAKHFRIKREDHEKIPDSIIRFFEETKKYFFVVEN